MSNRIEMTPQLAMAAGWDAANRRMRREGRTTWNEDDWNHAAEVYERCMGKVERRIDREAGK